MFLKDNITTEIKTVEKEIKTEEKEIETSLLPDNVIEVVQEDTNKKTISNNDTGKILGITNLVLIHL